MEPLPGKKHAIYGKFPHRYSFTSHAPLRLSALLARLQAFRRLGEDAEGHKTARDSQGFVGVMAMSLKLQGTYEVLSGLALDLCFSSGAL